MNETLEKSAKDATGSDTDSEEKEYKGDILTLGEVLKSKGKFTGAPFEVVGPNPMGTFGLPKSLGILGDLQAIDYYGFINFTSYDYMRQFQLYTGRSTEALKLKLLTGRQGREMVAKYNQWRKENLGKSTPWYANYIGADPEIFAENAEGVVIPAFEWCGKKTADHWVPYWDGFQAEFTIPPGTCLQGFTDNIQQGLYRAHHKLKSHFPKARLSIDSVKEISPEMLSSTKEQFVQFGCAPSYNLYKLEGSKADGRTVPVRFAGGHIHFGCGRLDPARLKNIVSAMDHISAVACVSLFANYDQSVRRQYYGLPGEYREPGHGLEYRTLSNAWLMHPLMTHLVIDLTRRAFSFGNCNLNGYWQCDQDEMLNVVMRSDVDGARRILERNKGILLSLLGTIAHYGESGARVAYNTILTGCEMAVRDPRNLVDNWNLDSYWVKGQDILGKRWGSSFIYIERGEKF